MAILPIVRQMLSFGACTDVLPVLAAGGTPALLWRACFRYSLFGVYGAAVDTSTVTVRLLLAGEEEIVTTSVPAGDFGFWEVNLELPADDVSGFVSLEVTIPDDDETLYSAGFEVR